jgi:hypothetical protein
MPKSAREYGAARLAEVMSEEEQRQVKASFTAADKGTQDGMILSLAIRGLRHYELMNLFGIGRGRAGRVMKQRVEPAPVGVCVRESTSEAVGRGRKGASGKPLTPEAWQHAKGFLHAIKTEPGYPCAHRPLRDPHSASVTLRCVSTWTKTSASAACTQGT